MWRPQVPGIDPTEFFSVFEYLEGPDVGECLAAILDWSPPLLSELAKMGAGTACGGSPEAITNARALWTSFGFVDALQEVARLGRRGEAVARFLARCATRDDRSSTGTHPESLPIKPLDRAYETASGFCGGSVAAGERARMASFDADVSHRFRR